MKNESKAKPCQYKMPKDSVEPYLHRFIETKRHRNEFIFIVFTVVIYTFGIINNNTTLLWLTAAGAFIEKTISYSTLLSDLSHKYQVHLFDIFSAYTSHFILFNSVVNALIINDPNNYDIANPTDRVSDTVNYTLPISFTQGFGDVAAKSRVAKYVQSAQTLDSLMLTLTFGTYILSSFVGKIKI
jgi:hypothetical protein